MRELRREAKTKPGEIWLIEQDARQLLAACDRAALTSANVVLYQHSLAPLVASVLPTGAYAEALPAVTAPVLSPRAINFAREGWSVVQIVEARSEPSQTRMRELLVALDGAGDLPVVVVAKTGGTSSREFDASLRSVPGIVCDFASGTSVTLVLGPMPVRYPAPVHAFAANGLAG